MDESSVLAKFDQFVEEGVVLFDNNAQVIEHVDGDLKVQFLLTNALNQKPTLANPGNTKAERAGSDISITGFEMGVIGGDAIGDAAGSGHGRGSHVLVANKFALARPHLMLLTSNGWRRQYEALDESDLTAAWTVLGSLGNGGVQNGGEEGGGGEARDYMVFFNCGRDGGCSRLHKHMQLMPTPEESFAKFLHDADDDGVLTIPPEPELPFHWFLHRFPASRSDPIDSYPRYLARVYGTLLARAAAVTKGLTEHDEASLPGAAPCPHNVVFTRRWMLVIPRRRGAVRKGIAANAVGMLGLIPVASKEEMEEWLELGPGYALSELGVRK